ncbi:MAG TPA: DUF924 family protein [Alphaproteobacteria bacterium]|jgi:uncharacterized protein (DUF924 family)|nr:DUF924 family protein [Alphaproteobacteria bacterium]
MIEPLPTPDDVIAFWFGDVAGDDFDTRASVWFGKNPAFDDDIRNRFGTLHRAAAHGAIDDWRHTPLACLALTIVLDQFPRNMYRGTAQAFATDMRALAAAEHAVNRSFDRELTRVQRLFIYLPFEHSERLDVQDRAVALVATLGHPESLEYTVQHRAIIARFGRFPHRNEALGRDSTREEIAFLKEPNSSF